MCSAFPDVLEGISGRSRDNDLGNPMARSLPRRACCRGTLAGTAEVTYATLATA